MGQAAGDREGRVLAELRLREASTKIQNGGDQFGFIEFLQQPLVPWPAMGGVALPLHTPKGEKPYEQEFLMQIDLNLGALISLILYLVLPGLSFLAARPRSIEGPKEAAMLVLAWFTHSLPLLPITVIILGTIGPAELAKDASPAAYLTDAWISILAIMAASWLAGAVWYSRPVVKLRAKYHALQDGVSVQPSVNIAHLVADATKATPVRGLVDLAFTTQDGAAREGAINLEQTKLQVNKKDPVLTVYFRPASPEGKLFAETVHVRSIKDYAIRSNSP